MKIHQITFSKSKRIIEKCSFRFHHKNYGVVSPLGNKWTEHFYVVMKEGLYANE